MTTFLRSQAASFTASAVDFITTIALVEFAGMWFVMANIAGNIAGAVTNFMMGRIWVFEAETRPSLPQAFRYGVVWLGYVAINSLLLVYLTELIHADYRIVKIGVSVLLSITYNYLLQKYFVFKKF